jgi:hypothetical protein
MAYTMAVAPRQRGVENQTLIPCIWEQALGSDQCEPFDFWNASSVIPRR